MVLNIMLIIVSINLFIIQEIYRYSDQIRWRFNELLKLILK